MFYNLFDPTPLTQLHIIIAGTSFILVYLSLAIMLKQPTRFLRVVPAHHAVYFAGFVLVAVIALIAFVSIESKPLRFGLLSAAFLTLLIGLYDEQYSLSPRAQLIWQIMIATIVVLWGWRISYISQPSANGIIYLDQFTLGPLVWPASFLTIAWLLLIMNAINWLDGIDGLAAAVGVIALSTLSLLTLLPSVQDSRTLTLSLLGAGAVLGFLVWNFPPARVFLGTSGSWFLGLYIGLVAIMNGGKIVTTLLVLAIPVVDLFFVIIQRLFTGRHPWLGDKTSHLHYRLVRVGLCPRTVVIVAIIISLLLGVGALTLQTRQKIIAFIASVVMLSLISVELIWHARRS
ncbi:MAG TPA: hypothetical protein DDW41_04195 [Candidatus Andersenbacteria bacterium]|nr:MAG: Glycosyl transferase, family 4, conserved region-containing protein [Parcubacteria group bacterium GW2011_GWA2_45_14]OGY33211.1 MAG: hypothetical protein A3B76_05030 [Candidatus Andersenbacteria bacterium RIFCSPHIGHO2_02_FULL_46_16]OGY38230.1 MAG: hypothetical protein A3I08_03590 [Candidatus Andersenbacteria bacterium RIFCSPLOWO2_02_FULL_46_11]HBE90380.1 hypothetical protein [Candidatus Andersenbacteria bacterium]